MEHYEITVRGHLGDRWMDSFEGMSLVRNRDGTTRIAGSVIDQAQLHSLLTRVRDLGLTLISVQRR